ncbi:MAG: response regulator [Elusimicrobiales bacterium]|jgi:YesN/AraC family two-component response regulator
MLEKILLVDDDSIFREEFRACFEDRYDITEASSGAEALRILSAPHELDLVVLDVRMPGMNGLETLKKIKAAGTDIGIVILTGHSSKETAIEALRAHADNYIEKPFDIEKARQILDQVLDARKKGLKDLNPDAEDRTERVKRYLQRNCFKKVSLADAAEVACVSQKHLSKLFKERTGVGFSEYKLKIKVEEAQKLLKTTAYSVDQISATLGYENTESFIRLFMRLTGSTPAQYRKHPPQARHNTPKRSGKTRTGKTRKRLPAAN